VHSALDAWTAKVDTKASIALGLEGAVLAFALTQSQKGKSLAGLEGLASVIYHVGVGLVVVSVAFALWVVFPQLRRWATRLKGNEWQSNTIYFGHLRHWDVDELTKHLEDGELPHKKQLAAQMVCMSTINWKKHKRLQWSLLALAAGTSLLLGLAAFH
jgi:hypothetical protein